MYSDTSPRAGGAAFGRSKSESFPSTPVRRLQIFKSQGSDPAVGQSAELKPILAKLESVCPDESIDGPINIASKPKKQETFADNLKSLRIGCVIVPFDMMLYMM